MKRCRFILLCALAVLCVLLAGCGEKAVERSEAGEVFTFCGGEAENFAKTFDVNEMNCMEYRYTMDTPISCRITDKAAMQTIFDALCEVKIGERTDMRATDSEQSLTFVKKDGTTCVIRFEQRNLLHEEDVYQLENDAALWKALREVK
mgnify:FL=1